LDKTDLLTTPAGFAECILGLKLYDWQFRCLQWYENVARAGSRVKGSLVTPNGAGKSEYVVAALALWFATCHKGGQVVITSKSGLQLDNQVWPSITKHQEKFTGWKFNQREVYTPSGGRIIAFTTDEASRVEGHHHRDPRYDKNGKITYYDSPLLYLVDEAKSVDEPIFVGIDRCGYDGLLYTSSPGLMTGRFYESQTKLRESFQCIQVGLSDCPHIPAEKIKDIRETYGEDHPVTKSILYGEFMPEDDGTSFPFPLSQLLFCYDNPPKPQYGPRRAFCDFAAGRDENVLAIADGNSCELAATWRDVNTTANIGRFLTEFRKHGLKEGEVYADEGGMGRNYCDALRDAGFEVHRVNNGSSPFDDRYINRGGEMWHTVGRDVRKCQVILPNDEKLKAQLTSRKARIDGRGKLGIEKKEDMIKRGIKSPDRADAVVGALAARPMNPITEKIQVHSWLEYLDEGMSNGKHLAGMDAGD
jgi:hypothetical protein